LGILRDGKPQDVEVTLDKSTSSSASAELISPALQGASLSDGQLKDGTKGINIENVEKGSAAAQAACIKMMSLLALTVRGAVHCRTAQVLESKPSVIALQIIRGNETSIYCYVKQRSRTSPLHVMSG
jgi:serine protease DegQ